jgi:putative transposase
MKFGSQTPPTVSGLQANTICSGPVAAAFALRISNRKAVFTNDSTVKVFANALTTQATKFGCEAVVYLFMPDHCHVVLQGKNIKAQPLQAMESFKAETHQWLQQNHPDVDWTELRQDQILREDEEISNQVEKILNNPVRKGIVKEWKEYKFKGSTIYDLDTWLYPI